MLVVVTGLTCMLMLIDCCVKWTVGTIYTIYTDTRMLGNISIIVLNTAPADTTHTASTSHCSTQGRRGMGKCIISLAKYFTVIVLDHKLYDSKTKLYYYCIHLKCLLQLCLNAFDNKKYLVLVSICP